MNKRTWIRWPDSFSVNRKSKTCTELSRSIQNRKWAGLFAALALVSGAVVAQAQQSTKIPRIGYMSESNPAAFRQGLKDLGYIEGKNILVEYRSAQGKINRIPSLVAELVKLKVDVLVVSNFLALRRAKQAT